MVLSAAPNSDSVKVLSLTRFFFKVEVVITGVLVDAVNIDRVNCSKAPFFKDNIVGKVTWFTETKEQQTIPDTCVPLLATRLVIAKISEVKLLLEATSTPEVSGTKGVGYVYLIVLAHLRLLVTRTFMAILAHKEDERGDYVEGKSKVSSLKDPVLVTKKVEEKIGLGVSTISRETATETATKEPLFPIVSTVVLKQVVLLLLTTTGISLVRRVEAAIGAR